LKNRGQVLSEFSSHNDLKRGFALCYKMRGYSGTGSHSHAFRHNYRREPRARKGHGRPSVILESVRLMD